MIMIPQAPCPECSKTHDVTFSHKLMDLYRRHQNATSREERAALVKEFAQAFVEEHDLTDAELTDDYHLYFEDYEKARKNFDIEALKVSRLAVHVIRDYIEANGLDDETMIEAGAPASN